MVALDEWHAKRPGRRVVIPCLVVLVLLIAGVLTVAQASRGGPLNEEQADSAINQREFETIALGVPRTAVIGALGAPRSYETGLLDPAEAPPCIAFNKVDAPAAEFYEFCFDHSGELTSKRAP